MAKEAQKHALLHYTVCKTNPIGIPESKARKHKRQLKWQRLKRQKRIKQTVSQEQLEKQNTQAENLTNDLMAPRDSGPKKEKGNNTDKTRED